MGNLVNAEKISIAFGTRVLLDEVSLGLSTADVIGVVGRNGDGKTTLLRLLTGRLDPDSGQVTRSNALSLGYLGQADDFAPGATIRDAIVGGRPDHVWAADAHSRQLVERFLLTSGLNGAATDAGSPGDGSATGPGGAGGRSGQSGATAPSRGEDGGDPLARPVAELSGGERRRVALTGLLLGGHDLLVLDEPTNHLDVEGVAWLAEHLNHLQSKGTAMLVVSHDRWFLDAICNHIWEVHDAQVDSYEGGYAAYVLARAERARIAAANESRRQNILRKELAWLRRGPPARTSKPKFRIDAANTLIADEPEPRDKLALKEFATTRLGKDVFDLHAMSYALPGGRVLFDHLDWSIGPGDRIGLIGVNGSGKTTLLNLLDHAVEPTAGKVKQGKTLRIGHLSQAVAELDDDDRVLQSVERLKRRTKLATGREASASALLEEFGFTGNRLTARIGDLSGGERRRLQFLRLLLEEPNVLLLDEPTNDLDIDTLTVIEDYLDSWPGTLIAVSHDRYFLERVCDVEYALLGDGRCVLLPGGVDEYLRLRQRAGEASSDRPGKPSGAGPGASGASGSAGLGAAVRSGSAGATRADGASGAGPGASAGDGQEALTPAQARQARKDLARTESQLAKAEARVAELQARLAEHASDYEELLKLTQALEEATTRREALETAWLELSERLA
ncbi:MAG: ABC-F family ATP-binding cassette domain-containing protein [Propionibacteriaceae bacterium]|jgi:ATPase subunit of ABC transporter with duplicated ATPase domains|nr:ABC-F family ATP-binding cassette domain-containing protein [Propionibacteriaceae bacterium]